MKKTTFIRTIKIFALILPVILFVLFAQKYVFCFTDHSTERIRRFYQEEENSLDVIFLGASEVFSGFAPALAYEEYGFTSYMYAIDSNPGALYKYELKEVLKRQQPDLLVVEINGFISRSDQYDVEEARLRTFVENIPFSINKLQAIYQFKDEDQISALVPFAKYHGDWLQGQNLISRYQWKQRTSGSPSLLKGITTGTIVNPDIPEITPPDEPAEGEVIVAQEILVDFIDFCRSEKLDNIVFVRFPHKNAEAYRYHVEQIQNIVLDRGYSFLNLEEHKEEMGIEIQQDYYNTEHLNVYGQNKLTRYLGNLIATYYNVSAASQSKENRLHWQICVEYYHAFYDYAHEMISNVKEEWPCEIPGPFDLLLSWMNSRSS